MSKLTWFTYRYEVNGMVYETSAGSLDIYVFFICFVGAEPAKEFFFEYAFCGGFLYASLSACLAV